MRVDKKKKLAEMQQIAAEKGGGVRSKEYVNMRSKMWFWCKEGHEWDATPASIKNMGTWCPLCAKQALRNKKVSEFKHIVEERGGIILSEYVSAHKKVLIRCREGHEWKVTPTSIKSMGSWCPHCAGQAPGTLEVCHYEASKHRGICTSPKYVNCDTKLGWKCFEGHEWEATLYSVKNLGTWCPYCAGVVPHTLESCQQLAYERGGNCKSPEYTNACTKMLWCCFEGHEWEATFNHVKNGGSWCPYCAGNAPGTLEDCQQVAYERGGICKSSEYINNSTKMLWCCFEGHEWEARFSNVKSGKWCPICRNKSENAVRTMLRYALELDFPPYSPNMLKRLGIELQNTAGNLMHLDGFNIDICAAFEFHGHQHTDGGSYFHGFVPDSFERRQRDDKLKREQCESAGIILFEIYEEQHGAWPHLNRLYDGLLDVLEENGVEVTGKPNLSDSAWMGLISRDREQTTLAGYIPNGWDPHVFLATRPF